MWNRFAIPEIVAGTGCTAAPPHHFGSKDAIADGY
jgi:hypothetical protein